MQKERRHLFIYVVFDPEEFLYYNDNVFNVYVTEKKNNFNINRPAQKGNSNTLHLHFKVGGPVPRGDKRN